MLLLLININDRLASVRTGITCIKTDKMFTYLETLATHTISALLLPHSTLREVLENIKRGMAQHPHLALCDDPDNDIWSY